MAPPRRPPENDDSVLQRLLTRMDRIEHGLLRDSHDQQTGLEQQMVDANRSIVDKKRDARKEPAQPPTIVSHRGLGSIAATKARHPAAGVELSDTPQSGMDERFGYDALDTSIAKLDQLAANIEPTLTVTTSKNAGTNTEHAERYSVATPPDAEAARPFVGLTLHELGDLGVDGHGGGEGDLEHDDPELAEGSAQQDVLDLDRVEPDEPMPCAQLRHGSLEQKVQILAANHDQLREEVRDELHQQEQAKKHLGELVNHLHGDIKDVVASVKEMIDTKCGAINTRIDEIEGAQDITNRQHEHEIHFQTDELRESMLDLQKQIQETEHTLMQALASTTPPGITGFEQMQTLAMEVQEPPAALPVAPLPSAPMPTSAPQMPFSPPTQTDEDDRPSTSQHGHERKRSGKPAYTIPLKNKEKLFEIDGDVKQYRLWKERLVDHMAEEWPAWRSITSQCERIKHPIGWPMVQSTNVMGFNGTELALDLWSFLSRFLSKGLYHRRKKMGINIEGNGFELWRRIFLENECASELVALAGRSKLMAFPQCRDKRKFGQHLCEWIDMLQTHGADISPEIALTIFCRSSQMTFGRKYNKMSIFVLYLWCNLWIGRASRCNCPIKRCWLPTRPTPRTSTASPETESSTKNLSMPSANSHLPDLRENQDLLARACAWDRLAPGQKGLTARVSTHGYAKCLAVIIPGVLIRDPNAKNIRTCVPRMVAGGPRIPNTKEHWINFLKKKARLSTPPSLRPWLPWGRNRNLKPLTGTPMAPRANSQRPMPNLRSNFTVPFGKLSSQRSLNFGLSKTCRMSRRPSIKSRRPFPSIQRPSLKSSQHGFVRLRRL